MTRVERLSSLIQRGVLSDHTCKHLGITGNEIGYQHIKARRARRHVPCGAGGTLADYVPFYFAPRSPMLFAITSGNVTRDAARTERIIYLVTSTQTLRAAVSSVVVSNRHAELAYADLSDRDDVLNGEAFIDWPLMRARYWAKTDDDPDRPERRQAECLAHPAVPWSAIEYIATKTDRAATYVRDVLGRLSATTPVAVRPRWYF